MTDIEFSRKYGWYVLRFKNILGTPNHIPFRKLQDAKDFIAERFCAVEIENPMREMYIDFCHYSNGVQKYNDFPIGNRYPVWAGYFDGAACLGCVKEVKGLGR